MPDIGLRKALQAAQVGSRSDSSAKRIGATESDVSRPVDA